MCMNILIPAAGLGTRFKDHYDCPKNMIDVKGEPMLVASARSLNVLPPSAKSSTKRQNKYMLGKTDSYCFYFMEAILFEPCVYSQMQSPSFCDDITAML